MEGVYRVKELINIEYVVRFHIFLMSSNVSDWMQLLNGYMGALGPYEVGISRLNAREVIKKYVAIFNMTKQIATASCHPLSSSSLKLFLLIHETVKSHSNHWHDQQGPSNMSTMKPMKTSSCSFIWLTRSKFYGSSDPYDTAFFVELSVSLLSSSACHIARLI